MRTRRNLFYLMLALLLVPPLKAQLSPGQLSASHEHLSGMFNCLNCHTFGDKNLTPKCLACHTPIKNRIDAKQGFHGQLKEQTCQNCHADHLGPDYQLIKWEPSQEEFDHEQTGFSLVGKHLDLKCRDCHIRELIQDSDVLEFAQVAAARAILTQGFLGLGQTCASCHEDVHQNEFVQQACDQCHTAADWKAVLSDFNHTKQTDFPLKGAHKKVKCNKCHKSLQPKTGAFQPHIFTGLNFEKCTDCHEDEHHGAFGSNCLKCHTLLTFKVKNKAGVFDHQATHFSLAGRHQKLACSKCHTSKTRFNNPESYDSCSDCHEDRHEGAFDRRTGGAECDQCHAVNGFIPPLFGVVEHAKTQFPLDGAHLAQPCIFCHQKADKSIYHWEPLTCTSCHKSNHGEQFKGYQKDGKWCETCHKSSSWTELIFKHSDTDFPLLGRHAEITCLSCHKPQQEIIQYELEQKSCNACHADVHAAQFKQQTCDRCHTPSTWKLPDFDHGNLTEFPLDGQHDKLACGACHKFDNQLNTIRFTPLKHRCQDCHSLEAFDQ